MGAFADVVPPTATHCVMSDNNLDTHLATTGDVITVTITASEPITVPSVTCGDFTFTTTSATVGLTTYTATYTVQASDAQGDIGACSITYTDLVGNTGTSSLSVVGTCDMTIGEFDTH